ncbi:hypothetical protein GCM10008949_04280 [Deinococcus humi]|nr:hypothetical protein GCM10008949_04280 [Deinococcus humi]
MSEYRVRVLERQSRVQTILHALTLSGPPVPFESLAARCELSGPELAAALLALEARNGSGPLLIDGGYVWVQIGSEAAD